MGYYSFIKRFLSFFTRKVLRFFGIVFILFFVLFLFGIKSNVKAEGTKYNYDISTFSLKQKNFFADCYSQAMAYNSQNENYTYYSILIATYNGGNTYSPVNSCIVLLSNDNGFFDKGNGLAFRITNQPVREMFFDINNYGLATLTSNSKSGTDFTYYLDDRNFYMGYSNIASSNLFSSRSVDFTRPYFKNSALDTGTFDSVMISRGNLSFNSVSDVYFYAGEVTSWTGDIGNGTQTYEQFDQKSFFQLNSSNYSFESHNEYWYMIDRSRLNINFQNDHQYRFYLCNKPISHYLDDDFIIFNEIYFTVSGMSLLQQENNTNNMIINTNENINNNITNMNNNIMNPNIDDITSGDLPSDNTQDITANGVNGIFQSIYNAFCVGDPVDIVFPFPFTNTTITLSPSYVIDNLTNIGASFIIILIKAFWWYLISRFIIKDVMDKINKIKSGNIEDIETTNIRGDML